MILTVDAGNTNIVFGVFDDKKDDSLVFVSRIDTNPARMADQYAVILMDILKLYDVSKSEISGAIISSVVPPVTGEMRLAISRLLKCEPMVIGPGLKTGLDIRIDDPSTLGADLAATAIAAKNLYTLPCIVVDLGSANKIFALNSKGALLGGTISPGITMSFRALASGTASLPLLSSDSVHNVIGTNTPESIRAGILVGTACMIDGMVERFEAQLGKSFIVATGGFAEVIKPYCKKEIVVNPTLLLQGLLVVYHKNLRG